VHKLLHSFLHVPLCTTSHHCRAYASSKAAAARTDGGEIYRCASLKPEGAALPVRCCADDDLPQTQSKTADYSELGPGACRGYDGQKPKNNFEVVTDITFKECKEGCNAFDSCFGFQWREKEDGTPECKVFEEPVGSGYGGRERCFVKRVTFECGRMASMLAFGTGQAVREPFPLC
jgi:hypothetical protein